MMSESHDAVKRTFHEVIERIETLSRAIEADHAIDEKHRFAIEELLRYYKHVTKEAEHTICPLSLVPPQKGPGG
jgi:hypothetical protein